MRRHASPHWAGGLGRDHGAGMVADGRIKEERTRLACHRSRTRGEKESRVACGRRSRHEPLRAPGRTRSGDLPLTRRTLCLLSYRGDGMFPYSLTLRAHAEAVRPCFLRKRPMEGRLRVPLVDRIHCSGFPDRADDGVRTRGLLLGKQACYHCTTSAWPCFFRIRRTAVTYSPPAERGMAGLRVGLTGFEPATPCSQSTCATKLRHNPIFLTGLRGLPATYVPY